jgi:NADH-quinone oxidoreductase subunit N
MEKLNILTALPEIVLAITASLVLLADVIAGRGRKGAPTPGLDRLALIALLAPLFATIEQMGDPVAYALNGMYVADDLGRVLKLCAFGAVAATLIYAKRYIADRQMYRGEFYALALFALLGQMVMISANNLLVVYLGLELMSLSLYALAALRRDSGIATEAAIKYFVLGALASGFLLYGMSMIYGGTGSLDIPQIQRALLYGGADRTVLVFGVVFVVAGLAFKFGAVPFHMWVPDVYQGTPTAATLLIAGAPKLAAFAIAFRLLAEGLIGVAGDWQQMLTLLSVASLVVGNLVAIAQTNFKRMLAYSTIAQVGFVLLGLLSGVIVGGSFEIAASAYSASMFYIITYVLTTLGTFGAIQLLAREGFEADQISDLRGLNKRSPWLAFVLMILMFSLAGVPPAVGFYAKLLVLQSVVNSGQIWLAVLAVLASLVGAFYYLRVVKVMYFEEPSDTSEILAGSGARATLAINGALVLGLGVLPSPLMTACFEAVKQALAG